MQTQVVARSREIYALVRVSPHHAATAFEHGNTVVALPRGAMPCEANRVGVWMCRYAGMRNTMQDFIREFAENPADYTSMYIRVPMRRREDTRHVIRTPRSWEV